MRANINIDVGGTFTDCFVTWDGKQVITKTPTTGYNLSVGFMRAVRDAASAIGVSVEELVQQTDSIRYSTTIAMNRLIERKGPRLGLITTSGFEQVVHIGRSAQWVDGLTYRERRDSSRAKKPEPLLPVDMAVGVKERVDCFGNIVSPLDEEDCREKVRYLARKGATSIVVSLLWSQLNLAHEQRVREIIREEYPECYLGSVPVVLSSEVLPKRLEYPRTMTAVLDAYLHETMVDELGGMGDELRDLGYERPLMMIHNTGGMAEVFRTTAVQTYNGGPVAGLIGSAYLGGLLGYENVIVTDMGGTSFDLGLIKEGSTRFYAFEPVIDRWQVDITMLETITLGAGGGSIAWLNPALANRLEVGPQSAGSMPGPAAYDLGGIEPTVTDADLVLGYIDPNYYHGGKMRLNTDKARQAIEEKIAKPMNISVDEAALLIRKIVEGNMGNAIFRETVLRGYDPEKFVLFAFGGAGPTHCCGYAFPAKVRRVVTFPFAPVFCAFGSANMDMLHIYEHSKVMPLLAPGSMAYVTDYDTFNDTVRNLQQKALKELAIEGVPPEKVTFSLELDVKFGGQLNSLRASSPRLFVQNGDDLKAIYQQFEREYSLVYSPLSVFPMGGVDIEGFALRALVPQAKIEPPTYEFRDETPPSNSVKGKRSIYWEEYGERRETDVYELECLECGNIINGPAIIEAADTTVVLPPGTRYSVNKYLGGEIERL